MKEVKFKITDSIGLHLEPAYIITSVTNKYKSTIKVKYRNNIADMKSTLSVVSLLVTKNDTIDTVFDGDDEEIAARDLADILKSNNIAEVI